MLLKFCFGAGKRASKILRGVSKDFSMNQLYQHEFKKMKEEDLMESSELLSKAEKDSPRPIHFQKPAKARLNKYIKQELKQAIDAGLEDEYVKLRAEIEDKTLKWQENRLLGVEAERFKKVVFKKHEIQRLLAREDRRPENYFGENQLKQQHDSFLDDVHSLNNERIGKMIQGQQADAFGHLVKSQLLQQHPEMRDYIQELMKQQNSLVEYSPDLPHALTQQVKQRVPEAIVDWESVQQFFTKFIEQHSANISDINLQSQRVHSVQEYSQALYHRFYENSLDLRVKGTLQFSHMTPEEIQRYVKYDINQPELVLRMIDSLDKQNIEYPPVLSSLFQKITTFHFRNQLNYLGIHTDERFKILMAKISRAEFDPNDLCKVIHSLALFRPHTIAKLNPKFAYHLHHNLTTQFLENIKAIPNDYFAMAIRNMQYLPISKSKAFQRLILQEIELRMDQQLSVYESESFLKFLYRIDNQVSISLVNKLLSAPQAELEMDAETIQILGLSIKNPQCLEILLKNTDKLLVPISECQANSLAPFLVMLSQMRIKKSENLVRVCKKRLVEIMANRDKIQDETDIANCIVGMAQIDSASMYSKQFTIPQVIMLNIIFQREPFRANSTQYIPYTNTLSIVDRYKSNFSDNTLILILQCLTALSYNNQAMIDMLMDVKDVQYIAIVYASLRRKDHHWDVIKDRYSKLINHTQTGKVQYLAALYHFQELNKEDFTDLSMDQLDLTTQCFLAFIASSVGVQITNPIPETIEQKYLMHFIKQEEVPFQRFFKEQNQLEDYHNNLNLEISTEAIKAELIQLLEKSHKVQIDPQLSYCQAHFLIDDKIAIKFISITQMIYHDGIYHLTGFQKHLQRKQKLKYLIYEEYIRSLDKEEYLSQFIN